VIAFAASQHAGGDHRVADPQIRRDKVRLDLMYPTDVIFDAPPPLSSAQIIGGVVGARPPPENAFFL
jgi:hypothetical protein